MIGLSDSDYYWRRAEQAARLAAAATMPAVRTIHHDMAARYRALADDGARAAPRRKLRLAP